MDDDQLAGDHSRRAGDAAGSGRRGARPRRRRHVTEDRPASRRRHRPGGHRGSRPHSEERRRSMPASRSRSRRTRSAASRSTPKASGLPERTLEACLGADAVLLGAVGHPKFDGRLPSERPEAALLALRQALGGFANLRPAICYAPLAKRTAFQPERVQGRQPADRPRAARRPVLRRAARLRGLGQHRVQHADLLAPRDRARGPRRVRARARAPQQGGLDRQGQRARNVAAVARGGLRDRRRSIRTSSSSTCTSIPRRCGWRPRRRAST